MFTALLGHYIKAITHFHAFNRVNAHHGTGNIGIETIKYRLTQAYRHISGNHRHFCTDRVAGLFQVAHVFIQRFQFRCIRAEKRVFVNNTVVNCVDSNRP